MLNFDIIGQIYPDIKASSLHEGQFPIQYSENGHVIVHQKELLVLPPYQLFDGKWASEYLPFDLNVIVPLTRGLILRLLCIDRQWYAFRSNGECDLEMSNIVRFWEDRLDSFLKARNPMSIVVVLAHGHEICETAPRVKLQGEEWALTVVATFDGEKYQRIENPQTRPFDLNSPPILGVIRRHSIASVKGLTRERLLVREAESDEPYRLLDFNP